MKKNRIAQAATVALLAALLAFTLLRSRSTASAGQDPQDVIYAMLNAARAGDVKAYLARYTGPMETALRQTLKETSEPEFARYLRDSNAALKGVALSDPQKITDREQKVRVEYVYQDRNEAQVMYLEKSRGGWKIARADGDERIKTLIPYGTPMK